MRGRMAAVAAALVVVAACGGDDEPQPAVEPVAGTAVNAGGAIDDEGQEAEITQVPMPGAVPEGQPIGSGTLLEVNNSGVRGSVSLHEVPAGLWITARVTGMDDAGPPVVAAIIRGSCEALPGETIAATDSIRVGPGGILAGSDTLNVRPEAVLDGAHAVVIKGANATDVAPPLACGTLPALQRP